MVELPAEAEGPEPLTAPTLPYASRPRGASSRDRDVCPAEARERQRVREARERDPRPERWRPVRVRACLLRQELLCGRCRHGGRTDRQVPVLRLELDGTS